MIPLRTSQIAFYAAVVTLTVSLATGAGLWFIRAEMLAGNDFLLDAEAKEILARISPLEPPIDAAKLEVALKEHVQNDEALFYVQVHIPDGSVIYDSPNLGALKLPDLTGFGEKYTMKLPSLGLMRLAEYHTPLVHVQIAMSLRNFESVNAGFLRVFLLGIPLIACLSVAFGVVLRYLTLRPIRMMQATARRITASNLDERIPVPPGAGDLGALARLLNEMIDRLDKSFAQVKRFTADTSHELMTPLSVIRLHTEKLLNDPELSAKHRQAVEEQLQETIHLTETIERLLTLAKAESSVLPLKLQPSQTCDFINQFAADAQVLAESRGLRLGVSFDGGGLATFDQGWIRQVMFNLFSNAMRHSPPSGTITCSSRCANNHWTVEIQDEGPGVPPERLEEIFERFVQITPRSGPGAGAGLGLAICKSIIELHKGKISARLRTNRSGLIVGFSLPINELATTP
jgi:signal transduction histidine kinase